MRLAARVLCTNLPDTIELEAGTSLLTKPFSKRALAQMVRQALDARLTSGERDRFD